MIAYNVSAETKSELVAALVAHGEDPRMSGALGRVAREDTPAALAGVIAVWPAEADGSFRIALSDVGGAIVWRAYAIAEIAAGRGRLSAIDEYAAKFGIDYPVPAYNYVCAQMKGRGIRPCAGAKHDSWTDTTQWVLADGKGAKVRKRWNSPAWRGRAATHEAYAAAGLAVHGRYYRSPHATLLFCTPKPAEPQPTLAPADDAALMDLA